MHQRTIIFCVLAFVLTSPCFAEGTYQKTKDGKTLIWNNRPQKGDAADWSGARDREGYATGYGTLTWLTTGQTIVTGSNIPTPKRITLSRYSGSMVKGKFEGPVVNVDASGRTYHGTFADGHKGSDWSPGPGSGSKSAAAEQTTRKPAPTEVASNAKPAESPIQNQPIAKSESAKPAASVTEPESPAAGPATQKMTLKQPPVPNEPPAGGAIVQTQKDADDSLRSLVGPPAGLRGSVPPSPEPEASVPSTPVVTAPSTSAEHLTAAQVLEIADAEARTHGYSLGEFQHPQAKYDAASDNWTVVYDRKTVDGNGMAVIGQKFSVTVADKSKQASLAPEK